MPFMQKTFKINQKKERYIGLPTVATNHNFLVHLMYDGTLQKQVARVYCRNKNFRNLVRFDLPIQKGFSTNFLIFPNYYLNLMLYRDEV